MIVGRAADPKVAVIPVNNDDNRDTDCKTKNNDDNDSDGGFDNVENEI